MTTSYIPASVLADRLGTGSSQQLAPRVFVREALKHRGYSTPLDAHPAAMFAQVISIPPPDGAVRGFCSRVFLNDGDEAHLPLLDFQCDVNEENTAALVDAMKMMGQIHGTLVTSGRSYHYYGFDPMTLMAWRQFMARSVLLAPLTDVRYLAHCLIEDLACLRIDPRPNQLDEPLVVAALQ